MQVLSPVGQHTKPNHLAGLVLRKWCGWEYDVYSQRTGPLFRSMVDSIHSKCKNKRREGKQECTLSIKIGNILLSEKLETKYELAWGLYTSFDSLAF